MHDIPKKGEKWHHALNDAEQNLSMIEVFIKIVEWVKDLIMFLFDHKDEIKEHILNDPGLVVTYDGDIDPDEINLADFTNQYFAFKEATTPERIHHFDKRMSLISPIGKRFYLFNSTDSEMLIDRIKIEITDITENLKPVIVVVSADNDTKPIALNISNCGWSNANDIELSVFSLDGKLEKHLKKNR